MGSLINILKGFVIKSGVLQKYKGRKRKVTIPQEVTEIGGFAFCAKEFLTEIVIPDGVTTIGSCAFYGCSSLTSVAIADSVTEIADNAFGACYSLADEDGLVIVCGGCMGIMVTIKLS